MSNQVPIPPIAIIGTLIAIMEDDEEEEKVEKRARLMQKVEQVSMLAIAAKRSLEDHHEQQEVPKTTRTFIKHDCKQVRQSVEQDYFEPTPAFQDCQFSWFFCITKTMVQLVLNTCCLADPFIHDGTDVVDKVKVLMGLKLLSYGVSASAFVDYMGITTGQLCFQKVCKCILESELLCCKLNRVMNRRDAHLVTELHLNKHGIDGMLRSLDCMHVGWKNYLVVWQGAFQGKEDMPTILLEAVADYNLWI
jgi:Plant transposon protein